MALEIGDMVEVCDTCPQVKLRGKCGKVRYVSDDGKLCSVRICPPGPLLSLVPMNWFQASNCLC
jgi:hypothetical protein